MNAESPYSTRRRRFRNRKGSSIAEFAPAMYFLLLVAFFPMLDLVGLIASYCDCQYLHFTLVRQAGLENCLTLDNSTTPPTPVANTAFLTDPNGAFRGLITGWYNGLGHFTTRSLNDITVGASINTTLGTSTLKYITITTSVVCNPLVPIPFFYDVPGFNKPVTFNLSGTTVIENVPS